MTESPSGWVLAYTVTLSHDCTEINSVLSSLFHSGSESLGDFAPELSVVALLETEFRSCCPGQTAMEQPQLTEISTSQVQVILLPQPQEKLRL